MIAVVLAATSAGLVAMALGTASGVTQVGPTSYETEFANSAWAAAGFLLLVPVGAASWVHPGCTPFFILAAIAPQAALPQLQSDRAIAAGWGDPLPGLGYLTVILMVVLFASAGVAGAIAGIRHRQARLAGH